MPLASMTSAPGFVARSTVQRHLTEAFETYGLPIVILVDNGTPWATASGIWTKLTVWLLRVGVDVIRSRIRHPQTLGKDERFHKTLSLECVDGHTFVTFDQVQNRFDHWRQIYNYERPHEAVGMEPPASRYKTSLRAFPSPLPPIEYAPDDQVKIAADPALKTLTVSTYNSAADVLRIAQLRSALLAANTQRRRGAAACGSVFETEPTGRSVSQSVRKWPRRCPFASLTTQVMSRSAPSAAGRTNSA